jgi:hypothetical protein
MWRSVHHDRDMLRPVDPKPASALQLAAGIAIVVLLLVAFFALAGYAGGDPPL